ncbi:MAG: energy-coupling factor ABC transporter ATP-binding protein [Clostridiaceae bacterium]|nr:energy-coupling factor ABC transporter ATP-binding protein [Clostridiaceae bacterium]
MKEKILEVKNLTFAYEKKPILNDITLSVSRGEKIAVMGSNGAGKSTFFLNLNGVLQRDSGEIFLEGQRIGKKDLAKLRSRIGFVFQDADSQIIASTVRSEVSFGPMNLGLDRKTVEKRVDEAIAYLALEALQDKAPHYLSGGEKKRVSIADILAMQPEILIFDEPMAALDPVNAEKVEEILTKLHAEGKTLLIATHDVDFAYRFADRILVFAEGRLIADEKPADIFQREEILEQAHLKKPAALLVWEALLQAGVVSPKQEYPLTPEAIAAGLYR